MMAAGLLLVATYAALCFDGLGHYAVAPIALHTLGANITILSEVAAVALLLPATVYFYYTIFTASISSNWILKLKKLVPNRR